MRLVDAHIHLDHMEDPGGFYEHARLQEMGLFSNTVTPEGFAAARQRFAGWEGVRVGVGLHPWWIDPDGWEGQLCDLLDQLDGWRYVGEVGLDFSARHVATRQAQAEVLLQVLTQCAKQGGKVISLHCVQAYDELLDLLDATGVTQTCACIIHWFSGTHEHLLRARKLGCWFSVGERLLSSKRGRAYVKDMPAERLLLETDAPPEGAGLAHAFDMLAQVRGADVAQATTENGIRLLDWGNDMFDAIAYINTPRWQESRLGLERIERLMDLLGRPQDGLRFVHVAGTNGKGSTCSYLASVLQHAGYKTGLFTSPYIERFEERIRVDGANISAEDLTAATLAVKEKAELLEQQMGEHPTEFELMTAVALVHFARVACDVVVLEVGLGGRLDSTNIIEKPEVSVICRLGLDHTAVLGDTLAAVAREKAGIIKRGCPVVSYPQDSEAACVIEQVAHDAGSTLRVADFSKLEVGPVTGLSAHDALCAFRRFGYAGLDLTTKLLATYQPCNAAVAIEAVFALRDAGWNISDEALVAGIANTVWPGRFEMLPMRPLSVVDGGHNPQGAQALADTLADVLPALRRAGLSGPVVLLVGLLADKDYPAMVRTVAPFADAFVATQPENPRALSAEDLAVELQRANDQAVVAVCPAAKDAVRKAKIFAGDTGLIIAFGSLYQIGQVKSALLG